MVHPRSESTCPLTGGGRLSADEKARSPGPLLRTLLLRSWGLLPSHLLCLLSPTPEHPGTYSCPDRSSWSGGCCVQTREALPLSFQRQRDLGSLMGKLLASETHMYTHTRNYTHTYTSTHIHIRMYILYTHMHTPHTQRTINTHMHECTHMHMCVYTLHAHA